MGRGRRRDSRARWPFRVPIPTPAEVRADGLVRWYGSPYAIAALFLLAVALRQLGGHSPARRARRTAVAVDCETGDAAEAAERVEPAPV